MNEGRATKPRSTNATPPVQIVVAVILYLVLTERRAPWARRIRPPGALYEDLSEAAARDHLAREFPRVPKLIIVAVLPASGRETTSVGLAQRAARDRLRDACSI
jgi:hypothetical protein